MQLNPLKFFVVGYGRHGKDTFAEKVWGPGIPSSSMVCAEDVAFPVLRDKYGYKNPQECFDDRHNHRSEWYEAIKEFNTPDLTALSRVIFAKFPVYIGIRNHEEMLAYAAAERCLIVWVDRSEVLPPESTESMTITKDMADVVIDNNGSLLYLDIQIERFKRLFQISS